MGWLLGSEPSFRFSSCRKVRRRKYEEISTMSSCAIEATTYLGVKEAAERSLELRRGQIIPEISERQASFDFIRFLSIYSAHFILQFSCGFDSWQISRPSR